MKANVGTNGRSCSRRFRFTAAKVRITGAAEGIIMATIISAHIKKSGGSAVASQRLISGPDIFIPAQQQTPVKCMLWASRAM